MTSFTRSDLITLLTYSDGRDKLNRTLQYLLRLLLTTATSHRLAALEHHVTLARKLLRMMNGVSYYDKGMLALQDEDKVEGYGRAVAAFGKTVWLVTDHVEFLYRIRVFGGGGVKESWGRVSNWLWFIGYVGSVGLYVRKMKMLEARLEELGRRKEVRPESNLNLQTLSTLTEQQGVIQSEITELQLNIVREVVDCGIPCGMLGLVGPGKGVLAGVVSSLVGLYQVYRLRIA